MNERMLMELANSEDGPHFVRDQIKKAVSIALKVEGEAAEQMAEDIVETLGKYFPGRLLYVPAINKRSRDAQIRSEFNGRNYADLAKKYPNKNGTPLSKRQIRRIVEKKDGV